MFQHIDEALCSQLLKYHSPQARLIGPDWGRIYYHGVHGQLTGPGIPERCGYISRRSTRPGPASLCVISDTLLKIWLLKTPRPVRLTSRRRLPHKSRTATQRAPTTSPNSRRARGSSRSSRARVTSMQPLCTPMRSRLCTTRLRKRRSGGGSTSLCCHWLLARTSVRTGRPYPGSYSHLTGLFLTPVNQFGESVWPIVFFKE
jgi:hypothetical protein